MKPGEKPPDRKERSGITNGWHLDIPAHALTGMTRAEIEEIVNVVKNGVRTPFEDWIDQNCPKNEPPEISEPDALVHKEIYEFIGKTK